jgi:hypothetical protein
VPGSPTLVDLLPRTRLEGAFGIADPNAPDGGKFSVPESSARKLVAQGAAVYAPTPKKAKAAKPSKDGDA